MAEAIGPGFTTLKQVTYMRARHPIVRQTSFHWSSPGNKGERAIHFISAAYNDGAAGERVTGSTLMLVRFDGKIPG